MSRNQAGSVTRPEPPSSASAAFAHRARATRLGLGVVELFMALTRSPRRRRTSLKRGKPPKKRSPKRELVMVQRRILVEEQLKLRPVCEARMPDCDYDAVDIHEPLTRARGGSILDVNNTLAVCRQCHIWIHDHPKEAHVLGFLKHSWEK